MMEDVRTLSTMRRMAWCRAKGEIEAMLETYWQEQDAFEQIDEAFHAFVKQVEDNGWHE